MLWIYYRKINCRYLDGQASSLHISLDMVSLCIVCTSIKVLGVALLSCCKLQLGIGGLVILYFFHSRHHHYHFIWPVIYHILETDFFFFLYKKIESLIFLCNRIAAAFYTSFVLGTVAHLCTVAQVPKVYFGRSLEVAPKFKCVIIYLSIKNK